MGDGDVFGFAGAVAHDDAEIIFLGELDGFDGFGERADLVGLDEDGVAGSFFDSFLEELDVGNKQVVADDLEVLAEACGEILPAVPVGFAETVLDADDAELVAEGGVPVDEVGVGFVFAGSFEEVVAVFVIELAGSYVHAEAEIFTDLVAGGLNGFGNHFEGFVVAVFDAGAVAAFVTGEGGVAVIGDDFFEGVEDFGAHLDGLEDVFGAYRNDHVFLKVSAPVGVGAAVDEVHHREGESLGFGAGELSDILVEGLVATRGCGFGGSETDGENGVSAKAGFVFGAV